MDWISCSGWQLSVSGQSPATLASGCVAPPADESGHSRLGWAGWVARKGRRPCNPSRLAAGCAPCAFPPHPIPPCNLLTCCFTNPPPPPEPTAVPLPCVVGLIFAIFLAAPSRHFCCRVRCSPTRQPASHLRSPLVASAQPICGQQPSWTKQFAPPHCHLLMEMLSFSSYSRLEARSDLTVCTSCTCNSKSSISEIQVLKNTGMGEQWTLDTLELLSPGTSGCRRPASDMALLWWSPAAHCGPPAATGSRYGCLQQPAAATLQWKEGTSSAACAACSRQQGTPLQGTGNHGRPH